MSRKSPRKKKTEPKYKEIAKGKVYNVEFPDLNFTWIDLRSENKKKIQLSVKDLGGAYSTSGKYDQLALVSDRYFQNVKPYEVWEMVERIKQTVTNLSGSVEVAVASNSSPLLADLPRCRKCETPLFLVGADFKCPKCGGPTTY